MKKLFLLLLFPFCAWAGPATMFGMPYPQVGSNQNVVNVNSSGQLTITLLSGEDRTNSVFRVESQFSYKNIPHADTQVKATAGFVHTVTCGSDAAATAGTIILYDNPAETGTVVYTWTFPAANVPTQTAILDVVMATGIYMGFTTTGDVDCVVSYR